MTFEPFLASFDPFLTLLSHSSTLSGAIQGHFGLILYHLWVDPVSFWGHFMSVLASFWHHFGARFCVVLTPILSLFGAFLTLLGDFGGF